MLLFFPRTIAVLGPGGSVATIADSKSFEGATVLDRISASWIDGSGR